MTYQSASTPIAVRAGLPPIEFSGQQEGEKILCIFHPHWLRRFVFIAKIVFVCLVFSFGSSYLAKIFVDAAFKLRISGLMGLIATVFYGSWWHNRLKTECRSYVTDRRVIRFEPMFPTFTSARGLFLSEIGKAK